MQVLVFSAKEYDQQFLTMQQHADLSLHFTDVRLNEETCQLAAGYHAVCVFVNDQLNRNVIHKLAELGIKHIALRCAGFNNLDIDAARQNGISVSRVPEYSPEAVAEHALSLMMTLNRKTHKAYNRIRESNFSLKGLLGFNLHQKTVGIIGTGHIGLALVKILRGFGCNILCYDPQVNEQAVQHGGQYVALNELFQQSDIISLHCPLNSATHHLINAQNITQMKSGVMLINTSRGGLIDTPAVIQGLKNQHIGYLGLDVYEMESELFFEDLSDTVIQDDIFERLSSFPNVLITGHQGFFTKEALLQIASTTCHNLLLHHQQQTDQHTYLVRPQDFVQ
ncbi:2-hydroxyacid dehydrogenase [Neptunicella marina]|uniref:2-hydroxyacid dehydrogenase n=1 Tax=Neptunicella marina TaxID=2125989 RepID=A0A8J6IW16_9ALTE|nr:2-hydroxyacid dehydrogenase [Neptunicella marina]MBC3767324.1 2-hydroxyacid dehydrogenase [Neptunicella marina]